jgi:hypothetical protein
MMNYMMNYMMNLHPKMRTPNCQVSRCVTARQVGSSVTDTIDSHRGSHAPSSNWTRHVSARSARWNEKWAVMSVIFARSLRMVHKKLGSTIIYTHIYICTSVLASFPSCGDSLAGFGLRRASRNKLLGEMELTNSFKLREFCSLQYLRYKDEAPQNRYRIGPRDNTIWWPTMANPKRSLCFENCQNQDATCAGGAKRGWRSPLASCFPASTVPLQNNMQV